MQITRGKIAKAQKFVVYGPEGIGKSTFVSQIPGVVFIDTEGSTGNMDVPRMPTPKSWNMLIEEVKDACQHPEELGALVIDTADWGERLCMDYVMGKYNIKSIEEPGYGKGYTYLYEAFGQLLNLMTMLTEKGVHAGFTAHAKMRKFEQPDEMGAYDRWEMKLSKNVAPLVKEWTDILLFANYKTLVYAADKSGQKYKAQGGQRVMHTTHHPCWDAKNRFGLPDELPFDFGQVAGIFSPLGGHPAQAERKPGVDAPGGGVGETERSRQFPPPPQQAEIARPQAVQEQLPIPPNIRHTRGRKVYCLMNLSPLRLPRPLKPLITQAFPPNCGS